MDWSGEEERVKTLCDVYFDADIIAEWEALQDSEGHGAEGGTRMAACGAARAVAAEARANVAA